MTGRGEDYTDGEAEDITVMLSDLIERNGGHMPSSIILEGAIEWSGETRPHNDGQRTIRIDNLPASERRKVENAVSAAAVPLKSYNRKTPLGKFEQLLGTQKGSALLRETGMRKGDATRIANGGRIGKVSRARIDAAYGRASIPTGRARDAAAALTDAVGSVAQVTVRIHNPRSIGRG